MLRRFCFARKMEQGNTIQQKTDMIMSNFLSKGRFTIDGKGKAIIVSDSRANNEKVPEYCFLRRYSGIFSLP